MNVENHLESNFTVDCVLFSFHNDKLLVLLTERNCPPYKDWWALPGYFVNIDEEMEDAVDRVCVEMTGLKQTVMEQLGAFAAVDRHPSGRILTVAYLALVNYEKVFSKINPVTDYMKQAKWFVVHELPALAFDHALIIQEGVKKLKALLSYSSDIFALLPEKFTLTELQHLYEAILQENLDKRNFRKKISALGFLQESGETQYGKPYRTAMLYKLDKHKLKQGKDKK